MNTVLFMMLLQIKPVLQSLAAKSAMEVEHLAQAYVAQAYVRGNHSFVAAGTHAARPAARAGFGTQFPSGARQNRLTAGDRADHGS
jgi:hypothetical protein